MVDVFTLGLVLALLGMGGTLVTLLLISLVVDVLKRFFPVDPPDAKPEPAPPATPSGSS